MSGCYECAYGKVAGCWRCGSNWREPIMPQPNATQTGHVQAPIFRVVIDEDGWVKSTELFSPGLPEGAHDLYADPNPEALVHAYSEGRKDQLEEDRELLAWAYTKLVYRSFDNIDDALNMDRIKLLFTGGLL